MNKQLFNISLLQAFVQQGNSITMEVEHHLEALILSETMEDANQYTVHCVTGSAKGCEKMYSDPVDDGEDNDNDEGSNSNGDGSNGEESNSVEEQTHAKWYGTPTQEQIDHITFTEPTDAQPDKLRFINGGNQPVFINYIAQNQYWPNTIRIEPGKSVDYRIPEGNVAAVRFWPKYNCADGNQDCQFGESGGPNLPCPSYGCSPPVDSKFEVTFNDVNGTDWYNASAVDGWTLPYHMQFTCRGENINIDCQGLNEDICPTQNIDTLGHTDLKVHNHNKDGLYGGCYSPCSHLTMNHWQNSAAQYLPHHHPADKYCCKGAYDTIETCETGPDPTMLYTQVIHQNCNVYAYAYDDLIGLQACDTETTKFTITFYDP